MSLNERKMLILSILGENAKKPHPEIVNTEIIAEQLCLDIKEVRAAIKNLTELEYVESNLEADLSLITAKGMHLVESFPRGTNLH